MKYRYNLALTPVNKTRDFLQFTQSLYEIAGDYKLSNGSHPHITLCQFISDEIEMESIWKKVCESSVKRSISLTLKDFSCINIDNSNWVSLLPDNLKDINEMHYTVANLIDSRIGRCFDKYDAHMTLINTKQKNYIDIVSKLEYEPIQDEFKLSLGISDEIGQLIELIHNENVSEDSKFKPKR